MLSWSSLFWYSQHSLCILTQSAGKDSSMLLSQSLDAAVRMISTPGKSQYNNLNHPEICNCAHSQNSDFWTLYNDFRNVPMVMLVLPGNCLVSKRLHSFVCRGWCWWWGFQIVHPTAEAPAAPFPGASSTSASRAGDPAPLIRPLGLYLSILLCTSLSVWDECSIMLIFVMWNKCLW